MGCGASKAALVADTDITIRDYPTGSPHHGQSSEVAQTLTSSGSSNSRDALTREVISGHSGIERAVREIVDGTGSSPSHPPTLTSSPPIKEHPTAASTTDQHRVHQQALQSDDALPRPVAFEVAMTADGDTQPKAPLPRRLSKLDSTPKLTTEMLAQKQLDAEERKRKELEKKAHPKMSKKDKLRREVMDARDIEKAQKQCTELERKLSSGNANRARLQADKIGKLKMRELRAKKVRDKARKLAGGGDGSENASFDPSEDIEVDLTYNTDEQTGFWESQSSDSVTRNSQTHQSAVRRHRNQAGGSDDDDGFFGDDVIENDSSSNNLEQYM